MPCILISLVLCIFVLAAPASLAAEQALYRVKVQGTTNRQILRLFKSESQSIQLQEKPASLQSLKRRANADVEKLIDIAKHLGYYDVKVSHLITGTRPAQILFQVTLGEQYTLASFQTISNDEAVKLPPLKDLQLEIGKPIGNQAILDAERMLLWNLKRKGYAICSITSKKIIADATAHTLSITFHVDTGPLIRFGALKIQGNTSVRTRAVLKRIFWKEGDRYHPKKIEETRQALEKTGLFSSLIILENFESITDSKLPVEIGVKESKHRSIGAGLSYATSLGPGIRAEWENRNYRGKGEKLTFRTEWWKKYQTAVLSLTQPYFHAKNQEIIWMLEYNKLHTIAFDSLSYNCAALIHRRLNRETEIGFGARLERLESKNFEGDHTYYLVKAPLQFKWSNANDLLDPTKGQTLNIKITPTSQVLSPHFAYTLHTTSLTSYHSCPNNALTLAAKVVVGNIIGSSRHNIPPPDRFYGGSENVLRGYRAYTVSPLHDKRTPIGGKSLLAGTLEMRFRTQGDFGWVFFYDVGNVYAGNVPKVTSTQLHSVGTGLRYNTPIGPLRFDVAVPVRRRSHIDPSFQVYFSIGQSF